MKLFVVSTLLVVVAVGATASKVDYTGHMVIRTIPETEEQLRFLKNLQSTTSTDFWRFPGGVEGVADIHVSPELYPVIARSLEESKLKHSILIPDVGKLIEQERGGEQRAGPFDYTDYHTYAEIETFLNSLPDEYQYVSVNNYIQKTAEENNIIQVTVSSGETNPRKPVIIFDCNMHARNWIATTTCIWMIENLASKYDTDNEIKYLLDKYDWKFIPVANPDGYIYTWTDDRNWIKNRHVDTNTGCVGVDIYRNFRVDFGGPGSASFPCEDNYRGPQYFSEPESKAVRDLLLAPDRTYIKAAFSLQHHNQYWMSPYGYKAERPAQYDTDMEGVMKKGVEAMARKSGTVYGYGSIANSSGVASGIPTDHYYESEGIVHSYKLALRNKDSFIVPAFEIVPTAEETWDGIAAAVIAIG